MKGDFAQRNPRTPSVTRSIFEKPSRWNFGHYAGSGCKFVPNPTLYLHLCPLFAFYPLQCNSPSRAQPLLEKHLIKSVAKAWTVEKGKFKAYIGSSKNGIILQNNILKYWKNIFEYTTHQCKKWQVALVKLDPWCELICRQVKKRSASWYSFKCCLVFGDTGPVEGTTCWYLEELGRGWYWLLLGGTGSV